MGSMDGFARAKRCKSIADSEFDGRTGLRLTLGLLVVLLESRDQVCLVAGLGETLFGKELLELGHLERRVLGHGARDGMGALLRDGFDRGDVCDCDCGGCRGDGGEGEMERR